MDRIHVDECKPAIQEAARRGIEHFRHSWPDQAIGSQPEHAQQQNPARNLNQAANDVLGMVQAARHVLLTDDNPHTRDAVAHILKGARQALEQTIEPGTREQPLKTPAELRAGNCDAAPAELAGRIRSERCDTLADAIETATPWAILADRRRLMAARGILSAVAIENDTTMAIPEYTARAIEAAMDNIDAATVSANIGN